MARLLSKLMEYSGRDISGLSGKELRSAYKSTAAAIRGRSSAFRKAGAESGLPQRYRKGVQSISSFESESEMRRAVAENLGYLRGKVSTYSGYQETLNERAAQMSAKLGIDFTSNADYKQFGDFMGEMQTRLKSMWKPASDFVVELYRESKRLNINPMQLMKNYEYWRDHLNDLKEADPIGGRSRELRPSDYIKAAKLEKISDYYSRSDTHDIISSAARKPSRGRRK